MTREEIEKAVRFIHAYMRPTNDSEFEKKKLLYRDMAIEALEKQPCYDYNCISRQAVLEIIEKEPFKGDAIAEIENLPSVTPKEKTGKWIDDRGLGYHVSICSNCNWRGHGSTYLIYMPKYCPNCGARMIELQESEVKNG